MSRPPFCPHCPHCREASRLEDLRLPSMGAADWLVRFAAAYRRARSMSKQPARLIREANPDLTADQVKWYRRRATDLGLLDRVQDSAVTEPAAADEAPAGPALDPSLAMSLAAGVAPSVALVRATVQGIRSDEAAQEYLDRAQADGLL